MRWRIGRYQQDLPHQLWYSRAVSGPDRASGCLKHKLNHTSRRSYEELAIEARDVWLAWNEAIRHSPSSQLPAGLTPEDQLLDLCGIFFLAAGETMPDLYKKSLDLMEKRDAASRRRQFVKVSTPPKEVHRLQR